MNLHKPVILSHLTIGFLHKICFEDFSTTIYPGNHIALIGDNGSGKSTLLSLLAGGNVPYDGAIVVPPDIVIGYLPQDMQLDQNKTVWDVATASIAHIIGDLQHFELLAQQLDQSDDTADEYDALLEKLVALDAFNVENKIASLLQQMGLADKKSDPVFTLSGGQQTLLGLVRVLAIQPDILLLDEPTNHLDASNREQLFSVLQSWKGTAIIVSHDIQLLQAWPIKIWEIKHGQVIIFNGNYTDYLRERDIVAQQQHAMLEQLKHEKKKLIKKKEEERERAAQSKKIGEKKYANAPKVVRKVKEEQAAQTVAKKQSALSSKQEEVTQQLSQMHEPKTIIPKFDMSGRRQYEVVSVQDGAIGYDDTIIVHDISMLVQLGERIAFVGDNGSGKSTIFKALLDKGLRKRGEWLVPSEKKIGYLDQKYTIVKNASTPFDLIKSIKSEWFTNEIRSFLNDFLFSKNEEVDACIATLSGGEKARLALAYIAAQSPSLLLLDEITNNIDLTTRNHIISVLNQFPGTLLVISHDTDFLRNIGIERTFIVANGVAVETV